ncbi:hypothetical protein HDA32_000683 [Spinactinospora alkalitolerans]|uniref:Probable membrane transporter protein n=1 Tax=Spinactinospora alkalitolerans TaxID=687207 RepID=A0A852TS63_9ACTN|nr:sulfite exporter TauE/SafE family protein [Spinactinospora alkalitolerans]NYE45563.1 hypothetical protein [Spinactinospora alkalitolerans]
MRTLVLLGIVGLLAQLVDGSLGMGYGVTSATLLLLIGANPAAASATVHMAQIGTTLAAGVSHWRFGNVDWRVVRRIALPGGIGAFLGAAFLSWLSTEAAGPLMSGILLALGGYILLRFTVWDTPRGNLGKPVRKRFLAPLGLAAGFIDSTGGGGWGPIGTPALLAGGRIEPRKVIGSIDTSEFVVALASSLGFVIGLGLSGINLAWVAVLLIGGVIAAPIAAWVVRLLPPRMLGSLVGGVIVLTNVHAILGGDLIELPGAAQVAAYLTAVLAWAGAVAWSLRAHLADREAERRVAAGSAGVEEIEEPFRVDVRD